MHLPHIINLQKTLGNEQSQWMEQISSTWQFVFSFKDRQEHQHNKSKCATRSPLGPALGQVKLPKNQLVSTFLQSIWYFPFSSTKKANFYTADFPALLSELKRRRTKRGKILRISKLRVLFTSLKAKPSQNGYLFLNIIFIPLSSRFIACTT